MVEATHYYYQKEDEMVFGTLKHFDFDPEEVIYLGNRKQAIIYMNFILKQASEISLFFFHEENIDTTMSNENE